MSTIKAKRTAIILIGFTLFLFLCIITYLSSSVKNQNQLRLGRQWRYLQNAYEFDKNSNDKETNEKRKQKVVEMMLHAWTGYKNYSWGANELRPISMTSNTQAIFGGPKMPATIVDAADTLWIMGLRNEYEEARDYIKNDFNMSLATGSASVFETTIRFVGGLLSLYALTGEIFYMHVVYSATVDIVSLLGILSQFDSTVIQTKPLSFANCDKARNVAEALLPAFTTPTGIPKSIVHMETKSASNYPWADGGSSILSEIGSLHLEFTYLSHITGAAIFRKKVKKIRNVLYRAEKSDGLYSNYINPNTGMFSERRQVSLGALGDSFYEYLIKSWIQSDKTDEQARKMYWDASDAIKLHLIKKSKNGLTYVAELHDGVTNDKMGHLACFSVGMFALQAVNENQIEKRKATMELAEELGRTCHESYVRTPTHIGPEMFYFIGDEEARSKYGENSYFLRPEVIEGYFYLWRLTGNSKYRDWTWDAIVSIDKYCRVKGGFSGLNDVNDLRSGHDDVQQSFFLAETLKYAYLTFSENSVIPLDQWVFNTEAHPLPVMNLSEV